MFKKRCNGTGNSFCLFIGSGDLNLVITIWVMFKVLSEGLGRFCGLYFGLRYIMCRIGFAIKV